MFSWAPGICIHFYMKTIYVRGCAFHVGAPGQNACEHTSIKLPHPPQAHNTFHLLHTAIYMSDFTGQISPCKRVWLVRQGAYMQCSPPAEE